MAQQSWWQQLLARINTAYERRIRAASLVTEYGADHHGHHTDHGQATGHTAEGLRKDAGEAAEEDGVVIANVPRGTRIPRSAANGDHNDH